MPINWGAYNNQQLGSAYDDYQRRSQYRPGQTGGVNANDPNFAGLSDEYNRRVGSFGGGGSGGAGRAVSGPTSPGGGFRDFAQWWNSPQNPGFDPVAAAGRSLPGEDAFYQNQIGVAQRALGAQRDSAQMNLGQALETRGFGSSSLVGQDAAGINRDYGARLGDVLGNVQGAQFASRERRIENAQNQAFQSGQSQKNFQYQMALLKAQLQAQGKGNLLGYLDDIFNAVGNLWPGGGGQSGSDVTGSSPYNPPQYG